MDGHVHWYMRNHVHPFYFIEQASSKVLYITANYATF